MSRSTAITCIDTHFYSCATQAGPTTSFRSPRDEDQESFFDGSSEQDRRRFRRRR